MGNCGEGVITLREIFRATATDLGTITTPALGRFHPCPPVRPPRLCCVTPQHWVKPLILQFPRRTFPRSTSVAHLVPGSVPLALALSQSLATLARRQPRIVKSISRVLVQGTWRHLVGDRRHHHSTARSNKYGLLMLVQDPSLRSCRAGVNNVCGSVGLAVSLVGTGNSEAIELNSNEDINRAIISSKSNLIITTHQLLSQQSPTLLHHSST